MSQNLIQFKSKEERLGLNELNKLLNSLKEKERLEPNPLLKDWFALRNQIRKIERIIRERKS